MIYIYPSLARRPGKSSRGAAQQARQKIEAGKDDLMSNRPLVVFRDAGHRPAGIPPEQRSIHCERLLQL
jgi:hypothetical protein